MQWIAQSWLVYRLTGSVVLLGAIGFASQIPVFLLALVGGAVADRHNRHRILLATQAVSMILALILAVLTLTETVAVWHLFVLSAFLGVTNAFDIPTRQAFVVDMVGKQDLINAIALNSSMFNAARVIGPAIAGILVATMGEGWCFLCNALSYLAVIAGLLSMQIHVVVHPRTGSLAANILEGFNYAARKAPIRALLLLLGLVGMVGMPYAVLMPVFADEVLHGGPSGLGILMGTSGLGALLAALLLASRKGVFGLGLWVTFATAGFGVSLVLFSLSRNFSLSAVLLVPVGFAMMTQMAASNTLIQAMVPDGLRGRVMSVHSMIFMGMAPVGALLAGAVADRLGAPSTVALGGGFCLVGSLVFAHHLPKLRDEGRRMIVALQMTGGEPASKAAHQAPAYSPDVRRKTA
jgi:MFS family permease